jgi:hypothetical protein
MWSSILRQFLKSVFNDSLGHLKDVIKKYNLFIKVVGLVVKVYLFAIIALID